MKAMIDSFQKLLIKYKLEKPVSAEVREYTIRTQAKSLKAVLKSIGEYNPAYGMVISTNVALRKMGLRTSMRLSRGILTAATSAIIAGIVAAVIYLSFKTVSAGHVPLSVFPPALEQENIGISSNVGIPEINNFPQVNKNIPNVKYRIGIEGFSGSDTISKSITDSIIKELARLRGNDFAVDLRRNKKKNINLIVTGSLRELDGNILITAKLVNVQTGVVLVSKSSSISGMNEAAAACVEISEEIIKHLE